MSSAADKLAKLTKLHDEGVITDDEYESKRSALIDEMLDEGADGSTAAPPQPSVPIGNDGRSAAKWTAEEQAAYKAAAVARGKPQKSKLSTIQKVGIGGVILLGLLVVFSGQLENLVGEDMDSGDTFDTISEGLTGSSQIAANRSLSGTGGEATSPFRLGGDYAVSMTASSDCYYSFRLIDSASGITAERLGSLSDVGSTSTRIYNMSSGSYYLDVNTGPSPSCPWRVQITG